MTLYAVGAETRSATQRTKPDATSTQQKNKIILTLSASICSNVSNRSQFLGQDGVMT